MKNLSLLWSIGVVSLFIAGIFFFSRTDQTAVTMPEIVPEGYAKYENQKYGFYLYHPPAAVIKEYEEGGGARTITLEDLGSSQGLQIFIVPYQDQMITDERFKRDVPSGVRLNMENSSVGLPQVPAVVFDSQDQFLGETREAWFIYGGYLYEITTLKSSEDWMSSVLGTWRFTN